MLQNAEPGTAKAEFPLAESSTSEYPEPEIEAPQCVEESVSKTPLAVTEAGAAYESPGDEAALATELCKANPAAPVQAAIRYTPAAPEVCFRFAALVSQHFAFAHMHCRSGGPYKTKMSSAVCIWHVGLE